MKEIGLKERGTGKANLLTAVMDLFTKEIGKVIK